MRCAAECRRLGLALGASLLLHASLLLPTRQAAGHGGAEQEREPVGLVIATRIVTSQRATPASTAHGPPSTPDVQPAPDAERENQVEPQHFFDAPQLSRSPRPLQDVQLDLPENALLTKAGTLVLTLSIDAQGKVVAYQVDSTTDEPDEYISAVAEAFSAIQFAPGEIAGRKVGSVLTVEISHEAADQELR